MTYTTQWDHVYKDNGEEDLEGTFKQAIYNVRVLVEEQKWTVHDACNEVQDKMNLTFQEYDNLYEQAQEKYGR